MKIVAQYSFNGGHEAVQDKYPEHFKEIVEIVHAIKSEEFKDKASKEKTMTGQMLYSPVRLNIAFKQEFGARHWASLRVKCDYPTKYYVPDYRPRRQSRGAYREMDFLKDKLGVELQLGKYAFMVYNVCAKMTIFKNFGHIDTGIELVPVKDLAEHMSTGVSYFEQFVWDLEARGVSDIDIPVLILGLAP